MTIFSILPLILSPLSSILSNRASGPTEGRVGGDWSVAEVALGPKALQRTQHSPSTLPTQPLFITTHSPSTLQTRLSPSSPPTHFILHLQTIWPSCSPYALPHRCNTAKPSHCISPLLLNLDPILCPSVITSCYPYPLCHPRIRAPDRSIERAGRGTSPSRRTSTIGIVRCLQSDPTLNDLRPLHGIIPPSSQPHLD